MKPPQPQKESSALKVWLQLIGLLALVGVVGYSIAWLVRHAR
jgi:flagellar biogenesis protein FliO